MQVHSLRRLACLVLLFTADGTMCLHPPSLVFAALHQELPPHLCAGVSARFAFTCSLLPPKHGHLAIFNTNRSFTP